MQNDTKSAVKVRHSIYLVLAAFLWGTTFVAQSVAMKHMEPFTFNMCRDYVGTLFLLPLAIASGRIDPLAVNYRGSDIPGVSRPAAERKRTLLICGAIVGLCMFSASGFQQIGLVSTTAGKSGFVTALYIVLVPVLNRIFLKKKCGWFVWAAVAIAVAGFYFLCIKEDFSVSTGDLITLLGSLIFAVHILCVDSFVTKVNGIQLSCLQLLVAGVLSTIVAFIFETPSWEAVRVCVIPIFYAGILSSGVAFTLQIVGQKGLNPTTASLLMSLESVISALAGWAVLGERLNGRELAGCALVFTGVVLAQIPLPQKNSRG